MTETPKTSAELRVLLAEAKRAERRAERIAGQRRSTVSGKIIVFLVGLVVVTAALTISVVSEDGWLPFGLFFAAATAVATFALIQAWIDYGYRQCDHDIQSPR